ncbi:unnamed protein product [Paramecium octaurelia]|uniref:Macro domain-containing protein n=1 Tax=Paramecium octaurelia TaxID=43137 RepID=A0A8S1SLI9_PAROT|nr:unnamed protein product [Paramecium octaurelia]
MFSIIQGDIFVQQAQAIALPSDQSMQDSPGLRQQAYDLLGRHNIQQPCNNYLLKQKPGSIQCSQAITLPINHKDFKYIIHCIVPKYDGKQQLQSLNQLRQLFHNIFKEIYDNKIKSILIPTLGCGNAGFTPDESFMVLKEIIQKCRDKIKDVHIKLVLYEASLLDFASDYFQDLFQTQTLEQKSLFNNSSQQKNQNAINQQQNQQQKINFVEIDDFQNVQIPNHQNYPQFNNQNQPLKNYKSNNINQNVPKDQEIRYYNNDLLQKPINQLPIASNQNKNNNYQKEYQQNLPSNNQKVISNQNQPINLNSSQPPQIVQAQQSQYQQPLYKSVPLQQQSKMFISLYIDIFDENQEQIQNRIDLLKFLMEVCQDVYHLHQKLLKNEKNLEQINKQFNYKLSYKVSENLKEIHPFCPPEMLESQYVSSTHDSFAIGVLFKMILNNKFQNQKDQQFTEFQLKADIQISDTTSDRLEIIQLFHFLSQQEEQLSNTEEHFKIEKEMKQFYIQPNIMQRIQEQKKKMLGLATKKNNFDSQLLLGSLQKPIENKGENLNQDLKQKSTENYFNKIQYTDQQFQQKIEKLDNLHQRINKDQDDSFQELNLNSPQQFQQNGIQNDRQLVQQQPKLPKIDCVAIPVNKYNFKQSLPPFIKLGSLNTVLEDIVNLAQNDKEHFLQSVRTNVPALDCNYVLLVFCPNQDKTVGRQIQLANCFRDILLYSLKCLKLYTCCLCLDDIYNNLIEDQTDLPKDTPIKSFQEAINKYPDNLNWNEIYFNNKNWIVVSKDPLKFKLHGISVSIYKQDITEIKGIDAIVNAANNLLMKGGGVCGSIFRAAGEYQLEQEINQYFQQLGRNQIENSEVVVTNSYNLMSFQGPKYIFHAASPIYNQQEPQKSVDQLYKCIINVLQKCQEMKLSSIAIPMISSGIFGFPLFKCAEVFYQAILNFNFQTPMSIHIVDVLVEKVEIFQIIFKGEKLREIIQSKLESAPPTDCLVGPIDLKSYNSGVVKMLIELAGPSFKNELEYKIKYYQTKDDIQYGQSILIQGYKLKFNNIYQVLLISTPQNLTGNKSCLLYQVFLKILVETFLKRRFSSITILIYGILQQCLTNEEELKTYDGTKAIKIFLEAIQDFQLKYNQECGKIAILSNVPQFCTDCELIFK